MPSYDKLVDHLPTLWRPQPGDSTLLAQWLGAVGAALDEGGADIQHVLRAHWFDTADAAAWSKHHSADRRERGLGALRAAHSGDRREALRYPYLRDLTRIGAVLNLPGWREPASLREGVEAYRQRVADVLDAYREGLVTPAALRRLVDAALPEDMNAVLAAQRGRFAIEEPVPLRHTLTPLVAPPSVQQGDRVAPLARWAIAGAPVQAFVIGGTAAEAEPRLGAPSTRPMVERYTPEGALKGIAVAYDGTLAPGQALRLAATRQHALLRGADLLASVPESAGNAARDPSANGPYTIAASLGAGRASALARAPDGAWWLLQTTNTTQRVQRHNGSTLQTVGSGAPSGPYLVLAVGDTAAWLGTGAGLFRCALWPDGAGLAWAAVAGVTGAVRSLTVEPDGTLAAAGAQGLWQVAADGSLLGQRYNTLDLHAWVRLGARELLATASALFFVQDGRTWRYDASSTSEALPDWRETAAADNAQLSPLPTITAAVQTADGGLWLASAVGLSRWYADSSSSTKLEAFPDLVGGRVYQLAVDDRGLLWVAAEQGLLRYDGRDFAQFDFSTNRWLPLGEAALAYPEPLRSEPRGFWRYDRGSSHWQRFETTARRFADASLVVRTAAADAVAGCVMAPALRAELGSFDGHTFTPSADVPATALRLRIKPDETRVLDGVQPYLPSALGPAQAGAASACWRYLQMAPAATPPAAGRPWWSTEGQLFLPPERRAAVPGHWRDDPAFLADAQREGQFDQVAFSYPPSARLWVQQAGVPSVGIRVRLFVNDPDKPVDPALAERVWQLIDRARPAGVPLQLMAEGTVLKESEP